MRKRKKYVSKFEDSALLVSSKIIEIVESNKEYPTKDKVKNVFKCATSSDYDPKMCVYWGRLKISVGDEIQMKGRFKDNVFLVWGLLITKKAENENRDNPNYQRI